MTSPIGFTTTYGIKFPMSGDAYKATITSAAIKHIDLILKELYERQTVNYLAYGDGTIVAYGNGEEVKLNG